MKKHIETLRVLRVINDGNCACSAALDAAIVAIEEKDELQRIVDRIAYDLARVGEALCIAEDADSGDVADYIDHIHGLRRMVDAAAQPIPAGWRLVPMMTSDDKPTHWMPLPDEPMIEGAS